MENKEIIRNLEILNPKITVKKAIEFYKGLVAVSEQGARRLSIEKKRCNNEK